MIESLRKYNFVSNSHSGKTSLCYELIFIFQNKLGVSTPWPRHDPTDIRFTGYNPLLRSCSSLNLFWLWVCQPVYLSVCLFVQLTALWSHLVFQSRFLQWRPQKVNFSPTLTFLVFRSLLLTRFFDWKRRRLRLRLLGLWLRRAASDSLRLLLEATLESFQWLLEAPFDSLEVHLDFCKAFLDYFQAPLKAEKTIVWRVNFF